MKRSYKLKNKEDKFKVEVEMDKIYWIGESVFIWEEEFVVIDRDYLDK